MNETLQVRLVLADDLEPVFANRLLIQHNTQEFILDGFVVTPGKTVSQIRSRLVMSPVTAKQLLNALSRTIDRYEELNGPIVLPEDLDLIRGLFKGGADDDDQDA